MEYVKVTILVYAIMTGREKTVLYENASMTVQDTVLVIK
jgi:hypothetical protein